MLKRVLFGMTLVVCAVAFMNISYSALPDGRGSAGTYATYRNRCVPSGSYTLTMYNYTGNTWPKSFKDFDGQTRNLTKEEYAARVNKILTDEVNAIGFGRTFNISTTVIDVAGANDIFNNSGYSGVEVVTGIGGDAYSYYNAGNRFAFRVGQLGHYNRAVSSDGKTDGLQEYFLHEFGHVLSFGHKDNRGLTGNIEYGNRSLKFSPVIYGIVHIGENVEDSVHGIDTLYQTSNTSLYLKITGNISTANSSFYSDGWAEAYLVDGGNNKLLYQIPIDSSGYFEFRARRLPPPGVPFHLMVCSSNVNEKQKYPYVNVGGTIYKCITTHTADASNQPPNSTYWAVETLPVYGMGWTSGRIYTAIGSGGNIAWNKIVLPVLGLGSNHNVSNISISSNPVYNRPNLRLLQDASGVQFLYPVL